ncbi:MAG: glycoside hydrolase family 88 protein [Pontiellaceae bacterium]|nr:glycoside hydrolase family 88 protein [Pontiellaceae bacterium]MBN2783671.1 glycoside hydrolase family 88 protein [Pontiellaceae bacterium]
MKSGNERMFPGGIAAFSLVMMSGCAFGQGRPEAKSLPTPAEVRTIISRVNDHWQEEHKDPGRAFWDNAAYHTGNMAAFEITGKQDYLKYSKRWADRNDWMGAKGTDRSRWQYHYGETDDHVLFGDWQICFQTYIDIYNIEKKARYIKRAREVMEYEMSTDKNDYWWWADGLYMVMPVMTKLYKITGNEQYLDKLAEYFAYSKSIMYDEETGLFFRDGKYVYPGHKSANGLKDFWARGDGWVFAGLAKVLADMPKDNPHRDEFLKVYTRMAESLAACQQEGGYWTRSLLDPEHAPGYETSGTAFFTFGYLWGINNGYLDRETYLPVALRGWEYLTAVALQEDGRVGYVQPIGERAIPGQVVDKNSTANFGVGAFLLAASEMHRLVD